MIQDISNLGRIKKNTTFLLLTHYFVQFDAYHFQMVSAPGLPEAHPDYDIWCTSDGNFTFLRGDIGGYMQTYYELTELTADGE